MMYLHKFLLKYLGECISLGRNESQCIKFFNEWPKKRVLMQNQISLGNFVSREKRVGLAKLSFQLGIKLGDRLIGLHKMQQLYQTHNMQGLSKEAFVDKLLQVLNIGIVDEAALLAAIPRSGPLLIASNHPFGGLEGVILARLIGKIRPELKVLANSALQVFPELDEFFIFTNPLSLRDPKNGPSLRSALNHIKQDGALLVFPAGKVSYYQKDKRRIIEHEWNRLVGRILQQPKIQYLPVFVEGVNSAWFYRIERTFFKMRMLFLGRELLNKSGQDIQIKIGSNVTSNRIDTTSDDIELAALARAQSYALESHWRSEWPAVNQQAFQALAAPIKPNTLQQEVEGLPKEQHLFSYRNFSVYFGYREQMPNVVLEIARLRELVFREHNEGSGDPRDTDRFDDIYTHLFVLNNETSEIIGAYRMGQTDLLMNNHSQHKDDLSPIYLSQMFNFTPEFINRREPCLEMGRSFLIPEYQRSFYGLYLLWRGIGAFVCKFPKYRYLYGTVSLSKLFDKRSIAVMKAALVEDSAHVSAINEFDFPLHSEIVEFGQSYGLRKHVSAFLQGIESDGKDIPILLKHYMKLNARFHALGVDKNFADTPGLLLSVHLPSAPEKMLGKYLDEGLLGYLEFTASG